jgi:thymidylate kinase
MKQANGSHSAAKNGDRGLLLLSFSGIDGAGKSTQISVLHARLLATGARVARLAFWDHVAILARYREAASLKLFRGDAGVGTPAKPVHRRDKNVRPWYLTAIRLFLYLLDAVRLRFVVAAVAADSADVILFDRYIYDELVNLPLGSRVIRAYVRLVLKCAPNPDVAYLLDEDPCLACLRKPEYPLDFVGRHRKSYLSLHQLVSGMKVIARGAVWEVQQEIVRDLLTQIPSHQRTYLSNLNFAADAQPRAV